MLRQISKTNMTKNPDKIVIYKKQIVIDILPYCPPLHYIYLFSYCSCCEWALSLHWCFISFTQDPSGKCELPYFHYGLYAALHKHGFIFFDVALLLYSLLQKGLIDSHSASTHLICTIQNSLTVIKWPLFSDVSFNLLNWKSIANSPGWHTSALCWLCREIKQLA